MKISEEIKRIVSCYNFPENEKRNMEQELQDYVDKKVKHIFDAHHKTWVIKMKKIAKAEWDEWRKLVEAKSR